MIVENYMFGYAYNILIEFLRSLRYEMMQVTSVCITIYNFNVLMGLRIIWNETNVIHKSREQNIICVLQL